MAGPWMLGAITSLLALALLLTPGVGMECFLCSYSPRSNSSRVDGCSDANFTEEKIVSRSCTLGCEAVTVYDTNDEIESFHRNCATNDTLMTNSCETYKTRILTRVICSCDFSYCNAAVSVHSAGMLALVAPLAVVMAVVLRLISST